MQIWWPALAGHERNSFSSLAQRYYLWPRDKEVLRSWPRIANDINIQSNKWMKQKRRAEKQLVSS